MNKIIAFILIFAFAFSIQAQTLNPAQQFIIGPQVSIPSTSTNWFDQTEIVSGKKWGALCGATPPAVTDTTFNDYILRQYYDLPLTMYVAWSRTNDPTFLGYARKCADEWWQNPQWIGSGSIRLFPDSASPPPRHGGVGGLILRAIDGRPEMWDWINAYTRYSLDNWLKNRISNPSLYYGVREGAFALHYATWLAVALPDSFPLQAGGTATNGAQLRAQYQADVENIVVNYFARLQQSDGSWRWDDPDYVDADGGHLVGVTQPFMVGLLLNAEIDVYRLTSSATVKASIQSQLTKALTVLYNVTYRKNEATTIPGINWRSFWYFYFGGTTVNPTKYANGGGSYVNADIATTGSWVINNERQAASTIFDAYAFAYLITGDTTFKTMGDELVLSTVSNADGFHGFADADAKGYNQTYRMGGRYAPWIAMATATPTPTPTPIATPLPNPSPSPSPSATPTPPPTRVIYESATFTFSNETQYAAAIKNAASQGYESCSVGPSGRTLYCLRVKQ